MVKDKRAEWRFVPERHARCLSVKESAEPKVTVAYYSSACLLIFVSKACELNEPGMKVIFPDIYRHRKGRRSNIGYELSPYLFFFPLLMTALNMLR